MLFCPAKVNFSCSGVGLSPVFEDAGLNFSPFSRKFLSLSAFAPKLAFSSKSHFLFPSGPNMFINLDRIIISVNTFCILPCKVLKMCNLLRKDE